MKRVILKSLLLCICLTPQAWGDAITIYATGVDDSGIQLAGGGNDPHYTTDSTGEAAVVLSSSNYWSQWPSSSSGGKWINFADSWYTYGSNIAFSTTFDLTGMDPLTAVLSGSWTCDNGGTILLNGASTGITLGYADYSSLFGFTISSGFKEGVNTLTFVVSSMDSADGLLVSQISGTASPVPEPGTLALLGAAGLGLAVFARRK